MSLAVQEILDDQHVQKIRSDCFMALWLNRSGKHCEHEKKFLAEDRIYLTWNGLGHDVSKLTHRHQLTTLLEKIYPQFKKFKRVQYCGQIWAFTHRMKPGDWVAVPSKRKTIHLGEIK